MNTLNSLLEITQQICDIPESNGHFVEGLIRRIDETGRDINDLKISELITLIEQQREVKQIVGSLQYISLSLKTIQNDIERLTSNGCENAINPKPLESDIVSDTSIKFIHAHKGEVVKTLGKSSLSNIVLLAAMSLTADEQLINDELITKYATNADGMKILQSKASDFLDGVTDSMQALTIIMSATDEEYSDELSSLHWLLCGLSELAQHVAQEQRLLYTGMPLIENELGAIK